MSDSPIINGLMIFFSVTTLVVIAYPIVKLLPSWLERSVYRKIALHRDAVAALDIAIAQGGDAGQLGRLAAQRDWHQAALVRLAPDAARQAPQPARIDAAA